MSNVYLTFSGAAYHETTARIVRDAPKLGADRVIVADDKWLMETPFYHEHKWLWEPIPRYYNGGWIEHPVAFGFGWCAWKPYIIGHVLRRLKPGDVLLYTDADTYPIADLTPIFDMARTENVVVFEEQGCENGRFTKRECLQEMGCDTPECRAMIQACGRFQVFRKSSLQGVSVPDPTSKFLNEWQLYATARTCQRWDISKDWSEHPEFARHSCEQSVLTNLAYVYGIPLHRSPDQCGAAPPDHPGYRNLDWDRYPQLFVQADTIGNRGDLSGSKFANIGDL